MIESLSPTEIYFLGIGIVLIIPIAIRSFVILFHEDSKSAPPIFEPVSILVAARNEEDNLKELLPILIDQDYPEFEIIVILDRCSDESLDFMKALEKKYKKVKTTIIDFVPDHFHPKKFALTIGIKGAKHEWLLLTDADCRPQSDQWIRSFSKHFHKEKDIVLGISPYIKSKGFLNRFIQFETLITCWSYISSALLKNPYMGVGRNLAYRKSLFIGSKGYNEFQHVAGGDDDLFIQQHAKGQNTAVVLNQGAFTVSGAKDTWKDYIKQKKRHLSVGKYYRFGQKVNHSLRSLLHLVFWLSFFILVTFESSPLIILLAFSTILMAKGLLYWWSAQKLGQSFPFWVFPFLDLTYTLFIPVTGVVSFFSKNIKWK